MRGFRGRLWTGSWGTLSRQLLAHFLVHSVRCVTDDADHDSADEGVVMGQIAGDTAGDCILDTAFGDGVPGANAIVTAESEAPNIRELIEQVAAFSGRAYVERVAQPRWLGRPLVTH
jgi:hypothetical protein